MRKPLGLYIHIPFCRRRCPYCDFTTYAGMETYMAAYVDALLTEMAWVHRQAGEALLVDTVYFGGGTPSLLPLNLWEKVFFGLDRFFRLAENVEITVEANPEGLTLDLLRGLRGLGVNRLSLGMQAYHPDDLRLLGRGHTFSEVIWAVAHARKAGFANLNLDLIYGLPYQSLARWQATLHWALRLAPDHLSCYALTLEHGTPMQVWVGRGRLPAPDEDRVADMYLWTMQALEDAGFGMYELSNWSRGQPCRHNLKYWRFEPYLGLGVAAHGFVAGVRTANTRSIPAYIRRLAETQRAPRPFPWTPATVTFHRLSQAEAAEELMFMGLRLVDEGVPKARFAAHIGIEMEIIYGPVLERLEAQGLLVRTEDRVRLTRAAWPIANRVFVEFLEPQVPVEPYRAPFL